MSRRISFCSDSAQRPYHAVYIVVVLSAIFIVITLFNKSIPTVNGNESQTFETVQTIESSLGLIQVEKSVSPEQTASFEPINLSVKFLKPQGVVVDEDDLAGIYGDFNVEFLGDETNDVDEKSNTTLRRWRLYPTRHGELVLPPIPIALSSVKSSNSSETESVVAIIPEQKFTIPGSNTSLKSVDEIAVNLTPIRKTPMLVLVVVAILIIAFVLTLYFLLSKKKVELKPRESQIVSPYERAKQKLDALKKSQAYLENDRRLYYEIDEILREYLAALFPLNAQEMTTHEILEFLEGPISTPPKDVTINSDMRTGKTFEAQNVAIAVATLKEPDISSQIEAALTDLDLIKFAKRDTSFNDATKIFEMVYNIVERSSSSYVKRLDELRQEIANSENMSKDGRPNSVVDSELSAR